MMITVVLMALVLMVLPVSAVAVGTKIGQGATVFIGEEGLDITNAMGDGNPTLGYWGSGANIAETSPLTTISTNGRLLSFSVTQAEFGGYIGSWYRVNSSGKANGTAFTVADPRISVSIKNAATDASVDGKTVTSGTDITFKIDTNVILNDKRGDLTSISYAPIADFNAVVNPSNGNVTFTPVITGGTPTHYEWSFSDAGSVTTTTATHVYAPSYDATLTIYNAVNGVSGASSMKKTITVTAPTYSGTVTVGSPSDPNPLTDPYAAFNGVVSNTGNVVLTSTSVGATTWDWDFGDGNTSSGSATPTPFQYSPITGTHTVSLSVTDGSTVTPSVVSGTVVVSATSYSRAISGDSFIAPDPANVSVNGLDYTKGYMDIIVKSEAGTTYSSLQNPSGVSKSLKGQFVNSSPQYWNDGMSYLTAEKWETAAKDSSNQNIYQSGIYTVYVECNLNGMKDNYKDGGSAYTGKTVSNSQTVTIGSDTLTLEVSKESVVRGKTFSVTVSGQPDTEYTLYLKGISATATNAPTFVGYQDGVTPISNNATKVKTDSAGVRTVAFSTSSETKDQKYTLRVVNNGATKSDEISITVTKGGVTVVAQGDQIYYLGEEIKLSGTNTETDTTYLFMVGPNLNSNGVMLEGDLDAVDNLDANTFTTANVESDDTYKFDWQTSQIDLDAGAYTVYAVSTPVDKGHLGDSAYGTVSITIKKPYVSASVSQPTVAKGDKIFIEGTAEGKPANVQIWILGKNYVKIFSQNIDDDSTYKFEFTQGETDNLASGQYFVVVQHPMQNAKFDIEKQDNYVYNRELGDPADGGLSIFKITGSGSLQGSDAAEALVQAISDPNVDDTYTKLNFIVEEPLIAVDTIGDKHVGDKFTLTGKTNLAVDDEILIEVYSSSFKPTEKTQSGEFSGVTGNVKVVKAETGLNKFSMDIDTSSFKVDEYIVMAQGITQDATGTALFNLLSGSATPAPTQVVTPVVTAPVITAPPTAPPTAAPTIATPAPTETTKSPGFGALFALAGIMGVAFIVVRRK